MSKKSLLFVLPITDLSAGGALSNLELMLDARKRGYIVAATVRAKGELTRRFDKEGIDYYVIDYGWWSEEDDSRELRASAEIATIINAEDFDLVVTDTLNIPWGALAASLVNRPHVWAAREFPFNEFEHLETKYDFVAAFSNIIMANSLSLTAYMREMPAIKNADVEVKNFYSFVDMNSLELSGKTSKIPKLVCVGRLQDSKNQLEVVRGLGILKDKFRLRPDLLLIGDADDDYKSMIDKEVRRLGLTEQVSFEAFKRNPWQLVSKGDIFMQPSRSESFGRTLTEAVRLGLVCVCSDIPANKEVLGYGIGRLYTLGDPGDLASQLKKAIDERESNEAKVALAMRSSSRKLSREACHDSFFKVIEETIGQRNTRSELLQLQGYFLKNSERLSELEGIAQERLEYIENVNLTLEHERSELDRFKNHRAVQLALAVKRSVKTLFKKV